MRRRQRVRMLCLPLHYDIPLWHPYKVVPCRSRGARWWCLRRHNGHAQERLLDLGGREVARRHLWLQVITTCCRRRQLLIVHSCPLTAMLIKRYLGRRCDSGKRSLGLLTRALGYMPSWRCLRRRGLRDAASWVGI